MMITVTVVGRWTVTFDVLRTAQDYAARWAREYGYNNVIMD